jgi:hypothetical protein
MAVLFTSGRKEFGRHEKKKVFGSAVKFGKDREVLNMNKATQNEKNVISC